MNVVKLRSRRLMRRFLNYAFLKQEISRTMYRTTNKPISKLQPNILVATLNRLKGNSLQLVFIMTLIINRRPNCPCLYLNRTSSSTLLLLFHPKLRLEDTAQIKSLDEETNWQANDRKSDTSIPNNLQCINIDTHHNWPDIRPKTSNEDSRGSLICFAIDELSGNSWCVG